MSITAMSSLFKERNCLNGTQIGLAFIDNGIGSIISTLTTGKLLVIDCRRVKIEFEAPYPSNNGGNNNRN